MKVNYTTSSVRVAENISIIIGLSGIIILKSNYSNITEPEIDKKMNNSGYPYYEMDSIYYCEWCTRDR